MPLRKKYDIICVSIKFWGEIYEKTQDKKTNSKKDKKLATTLLLSTGILTAGLAYNIVTYDKLDNNYQKIVDKYSVDNPTYTELVTHATNTAIEEYQNGKINDEEYFDRLDKLGEKPNEDILKQATSYYEFKEYEEAKKRLEIVKYATIANTVATGLVGGFATIKTIDVAENARREREDRDFY